MCLIADYESTMCESLLIMNPLYVSQIHYMYLIADYKSTVCLITGHESTVCVLLLIMHPLFVSHY